MVDPWIDDVVPVLPYWRRRLFTLTVCSLGALGLGFGLGWGATTLTRPPTYVLPEVRSPRRLPPMIVGESLANPPAPEMPTAAGPEGKPRKELPLPPMEAWGHPEKRTESAHAQ